VNRTAHLVTLAAGNIQLVSHAVAEVTAIFASAGSAVVAGGNDNVILDYDRAVFLTQTGASFSYGLGNIKIIIMLCYSAHNIPHKLK
jgi:hypothetical protein